jgi:hypothetical protein
VLEFDDNDVDCEKDDEIVVFVRIGDAFDEIDCGKVVVGLDVGELVIIRREVETDEGVTIDVLNEVGKGISKISTTFE